MTHPEKRMANNDLIQTDVDLHPYNTLGIHSIAKQFVNITDERELTKLANDGFFDKYSPLILGGGSNLLLRSDPGEPVLKISIRGIRKVQGQDTFVRIDVGAGEVWHDVVRWAVQQNLGGIENLALIPGTTGAAPIQNIGAYGVELESVFDELRAFDMKAREFVTFSKEECRFGYRDSVFKRELRGRMIVTSVRLKIQPPPHTIVQNYYALKNRFQEEGIKNPGIRDVFDAVVAIRSSKLPDPKSLGNAGSFFKNPVVEPDLFHRIQQENPKMPSFPAPGGKVKIPAGWLIEQAGWKGRRIGNVGTYKNQALVIVNHGGASGDEIAKHAERIRTSVAEIFGIELVPEVNIIG